MLSQTSLVRHESAFNDNSVDPSSSLWAQLPSNIKGLVEYLTFINEHSNHTGYQPEEAELSASHKTAESQYHNFCRSFKQLSQEQQQRFLEEVMSELRRKSEGKSEAIREVEQEHDCQMRAVTMRFQYWVQARLRINSARQKLTLVFRQRVVDIYLREYLMRRSKVHPHCIVLENVGFAAKEHQYKYHLKFQDEAQLKQLEDDIRVLIAQKMAEELYWEIKEQRQTREALVKIPLTLFLTPSVLGKLDDFLKHAGIEGRQSIFLLQSDKGSDDASLRQSVELQRYREIESSQGLLIECCESDETLYHAKFLISAQPSKFLNNFLETYKTRHKMLMKAKVLERREAKGEAAVLSAVYQKHIKNQKIYGQLLVAREETIDPVLSSTPTLLFSLMGIDHPHNQSFIQYLQVTVRSQDAQLEINLFGKFHRAGLDAQAVQSYLTHFGEVFATRGNPHASQCGNSLHAEIREALSTQPVKVEPVKPVHQATNKEIQNLFSDSFSGRKEVHHTKVSNDYLIKRYMLTPSKEKQGKIMREHFLWNNWQRAEGGGLVCKNEELVQRQKKMFKLVLKKFGETLLMGKNIINFSLPVVVFKKESHLESLAKSYLYAPIFTERAAKVSDPLERMKFSIVLMITENALSINMEKPFNPLLGETFQGWIDGCPIYLEQVSHHPPISAYYLVGRGYKKYGCIEPKISIGLNSGSGYSIFPHFVQFDDGGKIEYICAKICIGGLLIGERTFNFQDKIYAYDRRNRYFASVNFGPVHKGFFSSSDEPEDYFHGHIYRVSPQFELKFDGEKGIKPHPQDQDIEEKLSFFDGIWSSSVNVDGKEILNLKTDLPYEFVYEATPLPSNSTYREDLSNLLAGDLEAAQAAKEEMEEMQRRDRRLRQEHTKS